MNGPGFRVSLFVSGCTLGCKGCFNREAWNFRYGRQYTQEDEKRILDCLGRSEISGLSLLGGDPMERKNAPEVIELCRKVRRCYPEKSIWMWTGRLCEEIRKDEILMPILDVVDTVIDGPFIESLHRDDLEYSGSANQRVINIRHSLH